jgi:hypothetical protein
MQGLVVVSLIRNQAGEEITYQIGIEHMGEELLLHPAPLLNAREQTVDIGTPALLELLE